MRSDCSFADRFVKGKSVFKGISLFFCICEDYCSLKCGGGYRWMNCVVKGLREGIGGMMEGGVLKKVLRYSGRCMNDI